MDEAIDAALLAFSKSPKAAESACEALGDTPEGRALRALLRLRRGDLAGAQQVNLDVEPAGRAVKAIVSLESGDVDAAFVEIESALSLGPDDPIVLMCAIRLIMVQDPERALELARRGVVNRPHDPMPVGQLAQALFMLEDEVAVRQLADEPPPAFKGTPGHLLLLSRLSARGGDYVKAESFAREAIAASSDSDAAWLQLARVQRAQDRPEEAEQAARFCIEINPRSYGALKVQAYLARKRGDGDGAKRLDALAKEFNPLDEMSRPIKEVRNLFRAGRHEDMIDALGRLDSLPAFMRPAGEKLRLSILTRVGNTAQLRDAVSKAKGGGRHLAVAQAELLMRDKQFAEARATLESIWANGRPDDVAQYLLKARAKVDPDSAKALARELIMEPPGSLMGALGVALALIQAKMEKEYLAFLAVARKHYPNSSSLLRLQIRADLAYLRFIKAWNDCEGLSPKERKSMRRMIFSQVLRKSLKRRWKNFLNRRTGKA